MLCSFFSGGDEFLLSSPNHSTSTFLIYVGKKQLPGVSVPPELCAIAEPMCPTEAEMHESERHELLSGITRECKWAKVVKQQPTSKLSSCS